MEIVLIGTSSGITSKNRFHSSLLIKDECSILIDAGEGISKALIHADVQFNSIDKIVLTHFHADHFCGLPSLITQMKMNNRNKILEIYVHYSKLNFLETFLFHSYILQQKFEFPIKLIPISESQSLNINDNLHINFAANNHLLNNVEHLRRTENSTISLSLLICYNKHRIFYTGDIGDISDLMLFDNYDVLITESTHINLQDILLLASSTEINVIFTHYADDEENLIQKAITDSSYNKAIIAKDKTTLHYF